MHECQGATVAVCDHEGALARNLCAPGERHRSGERSAAPKDTISLNDVIATIEGTCNRSDYRCRLTLPSIGYTMYLRQMELKMNAVMKTRIVKMGNSHGIRIPKLLLEQLGLTDQVEVEVQSDQLVIRPALKQTRQGWEAQFQEMAARGDDQLLDAELVTSSQWDKAEWEW